MASLSSSILWYSQSHSINLTQNFKNLLWTALVFPPQKIASNHIKSFWWYGVGKYQDRLLYIPSLIKYEKLVRLISISEIKKWDGPTDNQPHAARWWGSEDGRAASRPLSYKFANKVFGNSTFFIFWRSYFEASFI